MHIGYSNLDAVVDILDNNLFGHDTNDDDGDTKSKRNTIVLNCGIGEEIGFD